MTELKNQSDNSETVKIILTGDFCPIHRIEELALSDKYDEIFNDLMEEFKSSDLNIIDLECPLVESGRPIKKTGPNLKGSPTMINLLKHSNIGLVAMANNHIRDYNDDGLLKTIEICRENGIATVGAGKNLNEARIPFIKEINGKRISVLNITENEWSNTHGTEPGANPLELIKNYHDIHKASEESDFVIVVFHGGNEFYELPSPRVKETLHFFAEAGASAIISHHTHIHSGFEIFKDVPIFYSLGNFCFDMPGYRNNFWNYGYIVRLQLGDKLSFEIIPIEQNNERPGVRKLSENKKEAFFKHLNQLNGIISDEILLENRFDDFSREKAYMFDLIFEPYRNRFLAALKIRKLIPSIITKRKKRLYLNIIRCEAHRDVLLKYLEKYR